MEVEPSGNFQIRMGTARKKRWAATCEARMVGENAAFCKLADWWMTLDPVMQAMVLGQLPPDDDLAELVLKRIKPAAKLPEGSPVAHVSHGQNATKDIHDAAYGKDEVRGEQSPKPDAKKKRGR